MAGLPNLTPAEWEGLLKRLTLYAEYKARKLSWRGLRGGSNQLLPRGHGPDSIAAEAIVSVIEGSRTCSAEAVEDMLTFLKSVVDSMINHAVTALENRQMRAEPVSRGDASVDAWHPATKRADGPAEIVADADAACRFRAQALKILEKEPRLTELFECLEAGIDSRTELAEYLGVTEDDVTNLKKRLARALAPLRPEHRKAPHA
ncbi:MAG: hypothetical protein IT450_01315 [Phycisphaerales bacterium]|nr:hypothetical protein [Phycisphaerales bacterium]